MRTGRSGANQLQMLDDQNRLNESMTSTMVPAGSIKQQLQDLITHMGFEAHKAEALLVENTEQERRNIDEYYNSLQEQL